MEMAVATNALLKQAGHVLCSTQKLLLQEMTSSHPAQSHILVTFESTHSIMSNVMKDLILKNTDLMIMFTFLEAVSMDGSKKITFVILRMVNVRNRCGSL